MGKQKAVWLRSHLLDASALALSAALWGVFYLPRLPSSPDFMLPRRAAWPFFEALIRGSDSRVVRAAIPLAATLLLLAAAAILLFNLWEHWRVFRADLASMARSRAAKRVAGCLLGLYVLGRAARFTLTVELDLIQNAWFAPEAVNLVEPAATWLALFAATLAFFRAAAALTQWSVSRGPSARRLSKETAAWAAALLAPGLIAHAYAAAACDAGKVTLAEAVALPARQGWRSITLLTQTEGEPSQDGHLVELGRAGESEFSTRQLDAVERYANRRCTVFRRPALRALYAGFTMEMEPERLRSALWSGHRAGDALARLLLLENLCCAPITAANRALLDGMADEARYRVGPKAAARLAAAYAHFGDTERSRSWQERANRGTGGLPAETIATGGQGLADGRIEGRIAGLKGARVGLYCRQDAYAPYALGPAQLVASSDLDANGAFRFSGLAAGDYFLAVAQDSSERPLRLPRVEGHRGDLRLNSRRPRANAAFFIRPE